MKVKINGSAWTVEIVTTKQMCKERSDGEHLAGLCIPSEHRILIAEDCISYGNVAHELYHAYWSTLYLEDTNEIKLCDIEEIAAAMFADKGQEIVKKAKSVLKRLEREE
jgi:hypothetical protein